MALHKPKQLYVLGKLGFASINGHDFQSGIKSVYDECKNNVFFSLPRKIVVFFPRMFTLFASDRIKFPCSVFNKSRKPANFAVYCSIFPAILFPAKIDRYFSGTSCTCFGIVFILVPYLIVCALARFSDLKRETSHYSI